MEGSRGTSFLGMLVVCGHTPLTPHDSWPPWNCLLATIKVGLDLMSLSPFQADHRPSAFLEHPSTRATTFSSSGTCFGWSPSQRWGSSVSSEGPEDTRPTSWPQPWAPDPHRPIRRPPGTWPWYTLAVLGSLCQLPERCVPGTVGGARGRRSTTRGNQSTPPTQPCAQSSRRS